MTSAENSVSELPNLKIFSGRITPEPPPPTATRLLPSALAIMPPPPPNSPVTKNLATPLKEARLIIQSGIYI